MVISTNRRTENRKCEKDKKFKYENVNIIRSNE